ncbi:hypothetical protein ACFRAR_30410 [Kitasatospora sp. NPDC056651]|uniref:hypothetical protein n=1 Tax=Kitasatospora sp. NPDC056651 TaxID=3345892 RepID=UPI0036C13501
MQALPEAGGRTRFVWHTDVLPDTLAAPIAESVEHGSAVIRRALEAAAPSGPAPGPAATG